MKFAWLAIKEFSSDDRQKLIRILRTERDEIKIILSNLGVFNENNWVHTGSVKNNQYFNFGYANCDAKCFPSGMIIFGWKLFILGDFNMLTFLY